MPVYDVDDNEYTNFNYIVIYWMTLTKIVDFQYAVALTLTNVSNLMTMMPITR